MKQLLCSILLFSSICMMAQKAFSKRRAVTTLGYGLHNPLKKELSDDMLFQLGNLEAVGYNTSAIEYKVTGFGPFFFKVDFALSDRIGLGSVIGYSKADIAYKFVNSSGGNGYLIQSNNKETNRCDKQSVLMGLRLSYHFGNKERVDPYIALSGGYNRTLTTLTDAYNNYFIKEPRSTKTFGTSEISINPDSPFYFGLVVGVREYLGDKFGIYVEAGIDYWTYLQAGIVIKYRRGSFD
jgi:hypothetical protein